MKDLIIVTVVPVHEVTTEFRLSEVKNIIVNYLQLSPMWEQLSKVITEQYCVGYKLLSALDTADFVTECPKFYNSRGTIANIKLIQAVLTLNLHLKCIQPQEIKLGVNAFMMACREQAECDTLYLTFEQVQRALRFCGKAISRKVFLMWVQRSFSKLECTKTVFQTCILKPSLKKIDVIADDNDITISDELKAQHLTGMSLMVHEFIYLIANTQSRVDEIKSNHSLQLRTKQVTLNKWEHNSHKVKIHLLPETAWQNKAPHKIVIQSLQQQASNKDIKFIGGAFQPKEDYSQVYSKLIDQFKNKPKDIENGKRKLSEHLAKQFDSKSYSIKAFHQLRKQVMSEQGGATLRPEYKASKYRNASGEFDFSSACHYDEALTISNIKRAATSLVLVQRNAPQSTIKTDYELLNKNVRQVSRINSQCDLRLRERRQSKSGQKEEIEKPHPYFEIVNNFCK